MAYAASGLILLAHGANEKIFKYVSSADALATIIAADYFLDSYEQFQAGDLLIIEDSGGLVSFWRITAASSTTVTVAQASGGVVANSETVSATTTVLAGTGVTRLTATATKTFQMAAPTLGAMKILTKEGATTIIVTVSATDASANFDGGSKQTLVFSTNGGSALLFGLSATRWVVIGGSGLAATVDPVIT